MRLLPTVIALVIAASAATAGLASADDASAVPPVSRVEVVLSNQYKNQVPALTEEFNKAGMTNVHFQFVKRGQPPQNIGLGRDVPADKAREAIRLAVKFNFGVGILLPERLFPPRFITIASSNFDDTVEYPIDQGSLVKLQDSTLSNEDFHRIYRELTSTPKELSGRY